MKWKWQNMICNIKMIKKNKNKYNINQYKFIKQIKIQ